MSGNSQGSTIQTRARQEGNVCLPGGSFPAPVTRYTGLLLYIVTKYESYFRHGSGLVGVRTSGPKR